MMSANYSSDKKLIFRIHEELENLNMLKPGSPNGGRKHTALTLSSTKD